MVQPSVVSAGLFFFSEHQASQKVMSVGYFERDVKLRLSAAEYVMQLRPKAEECHFIDDDVIAVIRIAAADLGDVSLVVAIRTLNCLLQRLGIPQVISGVDESFLSSVVELFVASVLEAVFAQALMLQSVEVMDAAAARPFVQSSQQAHHYDLAQQDACLMPFVVVGAEPSSLLELKPVSSSLVNVSVAGKIGIACVQLREEDFMDIEVQDLVPAQLIETNATIFDLKGDPIVVNGEDVPATLGHMIYKPVSLSLAALVDGNLNVDTFLKKPGVFMIDGPGCVLSGVLLVVNGQYLFSVLEKYSYTKKE